MIKYADTAVTFSEIPDEISLCINITNCPHHCEGCHSAYLREDVGDELTEDVLDELIRNNEGITCVSFMGEGKDIHEIARMCNFVKKNFPKLKTAIYSGSKTLPEDIIPNTSLDFVKLGGYKKEFGPLNSKTTNQRFYEIKDGEMVDITSKFW